LGFEPELQTPYLVSDSKWVATWLYMMGKMAKSKNQKHKVRKTKTGNTKQWRSSNYTQIHQNAENMRSSLLKHYKIKP
jgi:hypothetical protein